jgi:hypothetical protein
LAERLEHAIAIINRSMAELPSPCAPWAGLSADAGNGDNNETEE